MAELLKENEELKKRSETPPAHAVKDPEGSPDYCSGCRHWVHLHTPFGCPIGHTEDGTKEPPCPCRVSVTVLRRHRCQIG